MASIRKKLSMVFRLNGDGSPSTSKASRMDTNRNSVDSGYHSMIASSQSGNQDNSRANTFTTSSTESSPERTPKKLHKTISTTFSGAMQAFSNTVRSTTSYIYPTAGEHELPSSEWAECETPKKESRRSSIMSSVRSRKQRFTSLTPDTKAESPEILRSPVPVTQEEPPALEVEILNPSFSYESLEKFSGSTASQLLAGVGVKNLPDLDDPYVEQGDRSQHRLSFITQSSEFSLDSPSPLTSKHYVSDEKGYWSEVESNADISGSDGLSPTRLKYVAQGSQAHFKYVPPGLPEVKNSSPLGREPSKPETLDGTIEQKSTYKRLSADVYDADAESLESSMGSRAAWELHRAERERRYMEIVDMDPNTESDEEAEPELALKRSPSKKLVHYAEDTVQDTVDTGRSEPTRKYPTGDLRYAVEAIERAAFPGGDLCYAVEAIERPSITTFDPPETIFQQRPMLHLSDTIDGPDSRQSSDDLDLLPSPMIVHSESFGPDAPAPASTYGERLEAASALPAQRSKNGHSRRMSNFSDDTDDSCAITTNSPSCDVSLPFSSLHVRSEPAHLIPCAIGALATHGDQQFRIVGPANDGIKPSQHDLLSPSLSNTSSVQSPSKHTLQKTFNAAKLSNSASPSLVASRKTRRKLKRSSNDRGTVPFAECAMGSTSTILEPDLSQKSGPFCHSSGRNRRNRDSITSSSPKMKILQAGGMISDGVGEKVEGVVKNFKSRFEPQFSIKHSNSMSDLLSLHVSGNLGGTSYAGYELDSILPVNTREQSYPRVDEDLQQEKDELEIHLAGDEEDFNKDDGEDKDAPHSPVQKKMTSKPHAEAEKKLAVQKQLERKSDRACSRLAGKVKIGADADDHVPGGDPADKDGRPPWRP